MKNAKLERTIKKDRRAALVVNTYSRRGERLFFAAHDLLTAEGLHITSLYPVRNPAYLGKTVRQAIDEGHNLVIVGGGDGTLSAIVDYFANRDVVLGVLPLGTANSFVRSLGIPGMLADAVKTIVHGEVASVDLGVIDDDYFANVASIGFTTAVAEGITRPQKRLLGVLAYVVQSIRQAFVMKPFRVTLRVGRQVKKFETFQLIIANGRFYGPTPLAEEADVQSGQITILTMEGMGRGRLLWLWLQSLMGRDLATLGVPTFSGKTMEIHTEPRQDINIDGEVAHQTPTVVKVAPKALKVMVSTRVDGRAGDR